MVDYRRTVSVESTASGFSDDGYSTNMRESIKHLGKKQQLWKKWNDPDILPKCFILILLVLALFGSLTTIIYFSVRTVNIQSYIYNGSFVITSGETFTDAIYDRSSLEFISKAHRYENMLNNVFVKAYWGIDQTRVLCFGKENYRVYFMIILDKQKSLEDISSEAFTKAFINELQTSNYSLFNNVEVDSNSVAIGASEGNITQCDLMKNINQSAQETKTISSVIETTENFNKSKTTTNQEATKSTTNDYTEVTESTHQTKPTVIITSNETHLITKLISNSSIEKATMLIANNSSLKEN